MHDELAVLVDPRTVFDFQKTFQISSKMISDKGERFNLCKAHQSAFAKMCDMVHLAYNSAPAKKDEKSGEFHNFTEIQAASSIQYREPTDMDFLLSAHSGLEKYSDIFFRCQIENPSQVLSLQGQHFAAMNIRPQDAIRIVRHVKIALAEQAE